MVANGIFTKLYYLSKIYLRGLDGLRGIAAMLVVLGHVELIKKTFGYTNVYDGDGPFFLYLGNHAVTFFFVLSGFLITYLLLIEREKSSKISVKKFYLRRILRIWPVYYLLFFAGFIILPLFHRTDFLLPATVSQQGYWKSFAFKITLLPNFSSRSNPVAFQSWSIGVEEQFYILWPLIVSLILSKKKLLLSMCGIVIGIYSLRAGIYIDQILGTHHQFLVAINHFLRESRFDNMAIGAILAIIFKRNPNKDMKTIFKGIIILSLALILIMGVSVGYGLDMPIAAILFAGFIYIIFTKKLLYFLETKACKFLGKISYGLYMYHVIGIIIAINIMRWVFNKDFTGQGLLQNAVLYSLVVSFTISIAAISYYLMELRFLRLKGKLSKLET